MEDTLFVKNASGKTFLVRWLSPGDKYGLNDKLTWEPMQELGLFGVEFYDFDQDKLKFGERGQFVSRYYADTLFKDEIRIARDGLCLDGSITKWQVDSAAMRSVFRWMHEHRGDSEDEESVEFGHRAFMAILTPPSKWESKFGSLDDAQRIVFDLEHIAIQAAMAAKYISTRNGIDGCGCKAHDDAAKAANKCAVKMRKALGFAYPKCTAIKL